MDVLFVLQTHIWSVFIAAAVFFLIWKNRKGYKNKFGQLPPGPAPAPVVGNFFQVYVKEPYKYYIEVSNTSLK